MSDDIPSTKAPQRNWFERIGQLLQGEPKSVQELIQLIRDAKQRELIDADDLLMIEGVFQVSKTRAKDIMIPRSQMVVIERDQTLEEILPIVIESAHSRFPVIGENRDDIVGILLAKDLLPYAFSQEKRFKVRDHLRTAFTVPESKHLDNLLREFRSSRNHMAIVVDEYGGVSGLVTIEDILEQIVGDIEDEHDFDEDEFTVKKVNDNQYHIDALMPIEEFNEHFNTDFDDTELDTIGGMILQSFGHLPISGETTQLDNLWFKVTKVNKRRIEQLQVTVPYE